MSKTPAENLLEQIFAGSKEPATPAPRSSGDEAAFAAGVAAAASLPPMTPETAQRIAPQISAAVAEMNSGSEEKVSAA